MDDSWKLTLRVFDWQSMDSNHLDRKKAWLQKKIVHLSYSHFLSLTLTFCLSPSLTLSTSHFLSLTPFMQLCSSLSRRCHLGSSKQLRHNKCILWLRGHHWLRHQIQIQICTNTGKIQTADTLPIRWSHCVWRPCLRDSICNHCGYSSSWVRFITIFGS